MTTIAKPRKVFFPWPGKFAAIFAALIMAAVGAASGAIAQSESVLYSFAGGTSDGANPYAGLAIDGSGNLYGATSDTVLCNLPGGSIGTVGAGPTGTPALYNSDIYGTAAYNNIASGVGSGGGVVYECTPSGTYTMLHNFAGGSGDGENPFSGVVSDGNGNLYGTTSSGGGSGDGVVYKESTSGGPPTLLHKFKGGSSDGANPYAALVFDSTYTHLYGTTVNGGASGDGVIFEITLSTAQTRKH